MPSAPPVTASRVPRSRQRRSPRRDGRSTGAFPRPMPRTAPRRAQADRLRGRSRAARWRDRARAPLAWPHARHAPARRPGGQAPKPELRAARRHELLAIVRELRGRRHHARASQAHDLGACRNVDHDDGAVGRRMGEPGAAGSQADARGGGGRAEPPRLRRDTRGERPGDDRAAAVDRQQRARHPPATARVTTSRRCGSVCNTSPRRAPSTRMERSGSCSAR